MLQRKEDGHLPKIIFAAFLAALAVLAVIMLVDPQNQRTGTTVPADGPETSAAQRKTSLPQTETAASADSRRIPDDQVANFETALRLWLELFKRSEVKKVPLDDEAALEKIAQAKKLVAQRAGDSYTKIWDFAEVQRSVAMFGSSIPICKPLRQMEDATSIAAFDAAQHVLWVWPNAIRNLDPAWIANLLFHEATHVRFKAEALRLSGYTSDELAAIGLACEDFDSIWKFSTEALAFMNQGLWLEQARPDKPPFPDYFMETLRQGARQAQGDAAALKEFAAHMADYAARSQANGKRNSSFPRGIKCWPAPVIRGPRRGELFSPTDVAPDRLTPLIMALDQADAH